MADEGGDDSAVMQVLFEPLLVPGSLPKVMAQLDKLSDEKHVINLELNAQNIVKSLSDAGATLNEQVNAIQRQLQGSMKKLTEGMSVQQIFQNAPTISAAMKTKFIPGDANQALQKSLGQLIDNQVGEFVTSTTSAMNSGLSSALQKMRSLGGIDQKLNANLKAARDAFGKQVSAVNTLANKALNDFGKELGSEKSISFDVGNQTITRTAIKGRLSKVAKGVEARLRLISDIMSVAVNEAQAELASQLTSKQPGVSDRAAGQLPALTHAKAREIAGSKLHTLTGGKGNFEEMAFAYGRAAAQRQQFLAQDHAAQERILQQYQRQQFRRYKEMGLPGHTSFELATESARIAASGEGIAPARVQSALSSSPLTRRYGEFVINQEQRKEERSRFRDARSQAIFAARLRKEGNLVASQRMVDQARAEFSGEQLEAFENKYRIETTPKVVAERVFGPSAAAMARSQDIKAPRKILADFKKWAQRTANPADLARLWADASQQMQANAQGRNLISTDLPEFQDLLYEMERHRQRVSRPAAPDAHEKAAADAERLRYDHTQKERRRQQRQFERREEAKRVRFREGRETALDISEQTRFRTAVGGAQTQEELDAIQERYRSGGFRALLDTRSEAERYDDAAGMGSLWARRVSRAVNSGRVGRAQRLRNQAYAAFGTIPNAADQTDARAIFDENLQRQVRVSPIGNAGGGGGPPNANQVRAQFVLQLRNQANAAGIGLATQYNAPAIADAVEAAGMATIGILQGQGMALAAAVNAANQLAPEMLRLQRGLVKDARARLSPFSKTELTDRFRTGVNDQGLMGHAAEARAVEIRDELLGELEDAIPAPERAANPETAELYQKLRNRVVKSSTAYTGGRNALEEERQARAQEVYERFYGKGGQDSPQEKEEAIRRARRASYQNIQNLRTQRDAAVPNSPEQAQINRELAVASNHHQDIVRAQRQLLPLLREELQLETELVRAKNQAGPNPGFFAQGRIQRAKDALDRNRQQQGVLLGGQKGTVNRDYNQAIMQASYGIQDFFQVTAQPGMGPMRGLLAAANNLGPAMMMLGVASVPANLAIAGMLAGMTVLNTTMDKDEEKLKAVRQAVDEMSDSFRRSYEDAMKLQMGLSSVGNGIGKGIQEAQSKILGSPLTASPMNYLLESSRSKSLSAMVQDFGPGFNRSKSFQGWDFMTLPKMIGHLPMLAWEGASTQRNLNVPLDETERMFPKIGNFTEFMKSLSDEERKAVGRDIGIGKGVTGWSRVKYDTTANRLIAQDKFLEESGAKTKYMQSLRSIEEDMKLIRELRSSLPGSEGRVVRGGRLASDMSARDAGAREAYAKSVFENIAASRSQKESALNQLEIAEETYPEKIEREKKKRADLQKRKDKSSDIEEVLVLRDEIAQTTRNIVLLSAEFERIKETSKIAAELAAQAPKDFEALAKTPGYGRIAAKQLIPGLDQGGLMAANANAESVMNGIVAFSKISPLMHDTEKQFFAARSAILQFGSAFAQQVAKIENLESELAAFQATNFGPGAARRNQQFGIAMSMEAGHALGFELKPGGQQQRMLFEQVNRMRSLIADLERRGIIDGGVAGNLRSGVQAESLRRQMEFTSTDPLLQKVQSVNEFVIAVMNLGKAIEQGAALAKQGGLMSENQGAWVSLNAQLKQAGFNVKSLADELKALSDNEALLIAQVKASKDLTDQQKSSTIELIKAQSASKRELAIWNSPLAQSQRSARGGYLDDRVYYGFGGKKETGRQKNFDDAMTNLREERDRKIAEANAQKDPDVARQMRWNAQEEFNKKMAAEVDRMIPKNRGRVTVEGIESFHRSIQESLTTDPALQLEEKQIALLEQIRDVLTGKKERSEVSQEAQDWLDWADKPAPKPDLGKEDPNHPDAKALQAKKEAEEAKQANEAAKEQVRAAEAEKQKVGKWRQAMEQKKADESAVGQLETDERTRSIEEQELNDLEFRFRTQDGISEEDWNKLTGELGAKVSIGKSGNEIISAEEGREAIRKKRKELSDRKEQIAEAKKEAEERAKQSRASLDATAPFGTGSMTSVEHEQSLSKAEAEAKSSLAAAEKEAADTQAKADEAKKKYNDLAKERNAASSGGLKSAAQEKAEEAERRAENAQAARKREQMSKADRKRSAEDFARKYKVSTKDMQKAWKDSGGDIRLYEDKISRLLPDGEAREKARIEGLGIWDSDTELGWSKEAEKSSKKLNEEAEKKKANPDYPEMTSYRGSRLGDSFSMPESSTASALAASMASGKMEIAIDKIGAIFEEKLTKQFELWEEIKRDGIPQRIA